MSARRMTAEQAAAETRLSLATLRLMHTLGRFRCDGDGMYRAVDVARLIGRSSYRG